MTWAKVREDGLVGCSWLEDELPLHIPQGIPLSLPGALVCVLCGWEESAPYCMEGKATETTSEGKRLCVTSLVLRFPQVLISGWLSHCCQDNTLEVKNCVRTTFMCHLKTSCVSLKNQTLYKNPDFQLLLRNGNVGQLWQSGDGCPLRKGHSVSVPVILWCSHPPTWLTDVTCLALRHLSWRPLISCYQGAASRFRSRVILWEEDIGCEAPLHVATVGSQSPKHVASSQNPGVQASGPSLSLPSLLLGLP